MIISKHTSLLILIIILVFAHHTECKKITPQAKDQAQQVKTHKFLSLFVANIGKSIITLLIDDQSGQTFQIHILQYSKFYVNMFFLVIIIVVVFIVKLIDDILKDKQYSTYINRMGRQPCSLSKEDRLKIISQIIGGKWRLVTQSRSQILSAELLKIEYIRQKTQMQYKVEMVGTDQRGKFKLFGIILFFSSKIGVFAFKQYSDRKLAKQTDNFSQIIYEGFYSQCQLKGTWAFTGHQKQQQFSGEWTMQNKID